MKFAVQLYSVRDLIHSGEDLFHILEKVKALGFDGVEFAGFQGLSAETLRKKLDEVGLICVGAHLGRDDFLPEKLPGTLNYAKTLGADTVGVGWADTSTETELRKTIEVLGNADTMAKAQGMRVYFHNHTGEFDRPRFAEEPGRIFDRLKERMAMEVDTYWSYRAGEDNYKLITENKAHIVHLHIKDGIDGNPKALGEGDNDLLSVVKAAKEIGLDWLILENDDPVPDGLSDIGRSIRWLTANAR